MNNLKIELAPMSLRCPLPSAMAVGGQRLELVLDGNQAGAVVAGEGPRYC